MKILVQMLRTKAVIGAMLVKGAVYIAVRDEGAKTVHIGLPSGIEIPVIESIDCLDVNKLKTDDELNVALLAVLTIARVPCRLGLLNEMEDYEDLTVDPQSVVIVLNGGTKSPKPIFSVGSDCMRGFVCDQDPELEVDHVSLSEIVRYSIRRWNQQCAPDNGKNNEETAVHPAKNHAYPAVTAYKPSVIRKPENDQKAQVSTSVSA